MGRRRSYGVKSRIRELDVDILFGDATRALSPDIGFEYFRESRQAGTTASNRDGCTVHVHLALANVVEPGPSKENPPSLGLLRDVELEACTTDRTAAEVGFDDFEGGTVVLRD